jgi:hypothetical protein
MKSDISWVRLDRRLLLINTMFFAILTLCLLIVQTALYSHFTSVHDTHLQYRKTSLQDV